MAVGFFLMLMAPGLWVPALPNMLEERGIEWVLPFAFAVGPLASLFSPLIFGSMADYRFSAQKLLGTLSIVGAGFLVMAFVSIHLGWGAFAYLGFQTLNALIAAPMFSLLSTVTLANVEGARSRYPLFRVWGTLGWIAAGLIVSFLDWDTSPVAGMAAGCVRVLLGLVCFMMPETKPQGKLELGKPSWRKNFGLDALVLFKDASMRVFLLTSVFFAIPLGAFYMYSPILLKELGDVHPAASMTLGQVTEIVAMLMLSGLLARGRLRWVLTAALSLGVVRYGLFAYCGWSEALPWMWLGIALHGPIYAFYYTTAQLLVDRRVESGMRSQAQALLGTLGGIGGLCGSLFCGWYYGVSIGLPHGWAFFWGGLAIMVAGCLLYFVNGYRSTT